VITVGIVSPGAMGSAIGRALVGGGARVVATLDGRSKRTHELASGLEPVADLDAVVEQSAIVLSVVPPGVAVSVADDVSVAARRTGARPLYADLNAVSPATMMEMARHLESAEVHLVDGSISGPPPHPARTTTVYLSGPRAAEVAALAAPGLTFLVAGDAIGQASAVKMSTASFYKGSTALFAQALRAARSNGVLELVLDDLRRHYPDLVEDAPRLLQSIAAKSGRYVAEMEEIAATQAAAGLPQDLFVAFAKVYAELSDSPAAVRAPERADPAADLGDVLASLDGG